MELPIVHFDDEYDDEVVQMKKMIAEKLNAECIFVKNKNKNWSPFNEEDLSLIDLNYNGGLGKYYCLETKKYDHELQDVLVSRRICPNCQDTRSSYIAWRYFRKFNEMQVKDAILSVANF